MSIIYGNRTESARSISTVSEAADNINQIAKVTGQGIYNLSQALQHIRLADLESVPDMETFQALELYKTDHLLWTWRIYNMILGFDTIKASEVGDHHQCRLGKWVDNLANHRCQGLPAMQQLEEPHQQVHLLARQAAEAYERGDMDGAEQILLKMTIVSQKVVDLLNQLQIECKD